MTADQRVPQARDFLVGARKHKVTELPPSVLIREDAELRRQLGQLLDYIAQATVLSPQQREVLGQALADALIYRQPGGFCPGCQSEPGGLCSEHAEDAGRTDAYLQLAGELGIEVERDG